MSGKFERFVAIFGKISLWRSAIMPVPAADVTQKQLEDGPLVWIPNEGRFSFRADPFGISRDGLLHVFVERFDYRDRRGRIETLTFDEKLRLISTDEALKEPWHLSYPFVFAADGELWMLPEASERGAPTLYRATDFPRQWRPELRIDVEAGSLDATPLFWNGRWWLFYCLRRTQPERANQLHIASAEALTGPWHRHPLNPVRSGLADCRPAGTPIVGDGFIDLPVQDARTTYGGAVRRLRISRLNEEYFEAESHGWLGPVAQFAPFADGVHTLASAGTVTLVDFKRIDRSLAARLYGSWTGRR